MSIRVANENDVSKICSLVISLSHFYLESIESELPDWFAETLTEKAFLNRIINEEYQNFVYEIHGEIVGYLALKGNSHLYHLFVAENHQGKGISKSLWSYARNVCIAEIYTLRSSLFAIPIYQNFGFKMVGDAGEKDGIGFQSMELRV
ncbi:GNAT family N-acetyltransferase [Psychromonas sp. Urea-02u-13]|uniref:GNAT family N-acetyltransferase n=1 Tax=Psychromonas sp. Urea-02u-13 TaxID=2058326 RepID=UPI000C34038E|nr:GNAT family N-acetyltransferase [Psychromonas sp. Urea-02u-13]PKG39094.1 GNAT family N-acetyltransferase [Psychromonas sp. Urea-02u-13]